MTGTCHVVIRPTYSPPAPSSWPDMIYHSSFHYRGSFYTPASITLGPLTLPLPLPRVPLNSHFQFPVLLHSSCLYPRSPFTPAFINPGPLTLQLPSPRVPLQSSFHCLSKSNSVGVSFRTNLWRPRSDISGVILPRQTTFLQAV